MKFIYVAAFTEPNHQEMVHFVHEFVEGETPEENDDDAIYASDAFYRARKIVNKRHRDGEIPGDFVNDYITEID